MRLNYAIIFISNMERSVAFYRDVFGSRIAQYLDPDGLVVSVSEISKID